MALKTNSAVIMPPPVPSKTTNSMELRPAKPLEHIQPRWPWVAAGLLLALIAGFLAWWWWNKKRNGQAKSRHPHPSSPQGQGSTSSRPELASGSLRVLLTAFGSVKDLSRGAVFLTCTGADY